MDAERFANSPVGHLVLFTGTDLEGHAYEHSAYAAHPLDEEPLLTGQTWRAVGDARAALGRLHQGSRFVGDTALLRQPTLRREAQSTSALEGTYAPLEDVLAADVIDHGKRSMELTEVLNFVEAAESAFAWLSDGFAINTSLVCGLHATLVAGTSADTDEAGRVRSIQVAIGSRGGGLQDARFVPMRPGPALDAAVRDLFDWMGDAGKRSTIDPVVSAALGHYQFETLHPFNDGNGRLGRLLIVLQLLQSGLLPDSLLSVSPWFEARRDEYQDRLAEVSASGDWDQWVEFFARGITASANATAERIETVLDIQHGFHERLRQANVRGLVRDIVDIVVASPYTTIPQLANSTGKPYQTVKNAVERLVDLHILEEIPGGTRVFRATAIVNVYRQ